LVIGVLLAAPLLVLAVSGSLLVFEHELNMLQEPDRYRLEGGSAARLHLAFTAATDAHPTWRPLGLIRVEGGEQAPFRAIFADEAGEQRKLLLDPFGGRLLGEERSGRIAEVARELHVELLAGDLGEAVRNPMGLAILFMVALGLYLWWPGRGRVRRSIGVRRSFPPRRFHRDLHVTVGTFATLLLAASSLTGTLLAYPETAASFVNLFSRVDPQATGSEAVPATVQPGRPPMSPAQLIAAAGSAGPIPSLPSLVVLSTDAAVRVVIKSPGAPTMIHFLDPYTARPLKRMILGEMSWRTRLFAEWGQTLHNGRIGGFAGRLLAALTGVALALLIISGLLHWKARGRKARP
jgi:uncharacterized iron-regulated membrane protein